MDSTIWIALIGILGTLFGVWLGYFLQNQNLKRQREWLLHDQKSEWLRKQKNDDYELILTYIEGTMKYLTLIGDTLKSLSPAKLEELNLEFNKQIALVLPILEGMKNDEKELYELMGEFVKEKDDLFKTIINTKNASKGDANKLIKMAGQIKIKINESLAKTFN